MITFVSAPETPFDSLVSFIFFPPFTTDFSCCPPKVKLPCFCMRHSQPLNATCECLWAYKYALRGKEKVKLSYWIDWAFMKLKRALPSRLLECGKWLPDISDVPYGTQPWGSLPYSQVLSCCPAGTIQLLHLLWVEQGGLILPLTTLHMHAFDFIEIIAQLFYMVSYFALL